MKSVFFFVSMDQANIFFVVVGIAILGLIDGFFLTLFLFKPSKKADDDDGGL